MTRRSALRASDSDRELAAERLREAAAQGRLTADELEERLHTTFRARTYGQLGVAVADLPPPGTAGETMPIWARASLALAAAVGVLAAAAMAAVLFAFIAGASAAWMVLSRAIAARGGRPRGSARAATR